VAGFHSLLNNIILQRAPLESASPENFLASINGGCASFWNIVRADFLVAYQQKTYTQVDPDDMVLWKAAGLRLTTDRPVTSPVQMSNLTFEHSKGDDECRTLIWILAKTTNFLSGNDQSHSRNHYSSTWDELRKCLETWYENLPSLFQPYASVTFGELSEAADGSSKSRFDRHLFTVPMCAVALLLYHFARILLLMNWPIETIEQGASRLRMFSKISRESHHHGRQICNIALGIRNYLPAYEQMIEPLYVAGVCLDEDEDRLVVIGLLRDIEKNTGHLATERVRDLLSTWGWEDRSDTQLVSSE
jgi:hypothetical protein